MADNMKQSIDALTFASQVVGRTTSVIINSGIYAHDYERDDTEEDIITIVGTPETPITLQDVLEAFRRMQFQFEDDDSGRSYFYEGLNYNVKLGEYEISWGS